MGGGINTVRCPLFPWPGGCLLSSAVINSSEMTQQCIVHLMSCEQCYSVTDDAESDGLTLTQQQIAFISSADEVTFSSAL